MNINFIKKIGKFSTFGIKPDLTVLFDLPAEKGLRRCGKVKDRIERRHLNYHRRVRSGYLELARLEPKRIKVIKVDGSKKKIQKKIKDLVLNVI